MRRFSSARARTPHKEKGGLLDPPLASSYICRRLAEVPQPLERRTLR
jgi:hypothetical protein